MDISKPLAPNAIISLEVISLAIPKLQKLVQALKSVKIDATTWNESFRNDLDGLQKAIESTLIDIFGSNSAEYHEFEVVDFMYSVSISMDSTLPFEYVTGYQTAVNNAIVTLEAAIQLLGAKFTDSKKQSKQTTINLTLHPEIARRTSKLLDEGNYSDATEASINALLTLIRLRSGSDLDGVSLTDKVFDPHNPILKFNSMADERERNQHKSLAALFAGGVAVLDAARTEKRIEISQASDFIALASLLAKLLERAK